MYVLESSKLTKKRVIVTLGQHVFPCYQDPLTHQLFDMQLSYGMGA